MSVLKLSRPLRLSLLSALIVGAGFVTLALIATFGHYRRDLPGFWDYPSGTIGDALLLPTLIVGLVVQAGALERAPRERRKALAGAAIGAAIGASVPISWLLDPHANSIWMIPHPHDWTPAWAWHLFFTTVTSAALGALSLVLYSRMREASEPSESMPASRIRPVALTAAVSAGLGMLLLIGRDAVVGGMTAASATTGAALVVAAVAFLGGLKLAARHVNWADIRIPAAVCTLFVVGLLAVIVRWRPQLPALAGISAVSAGLACTAACSRLPFAEALVRYRWLAAAAGATVITGGLIRAMDAAQHGQSRPLLWLVGALALTVGPLVLGGVKGDGEERWRAARYGLFAGYCMLTLFLAARVHDLNSSGNAAAAVGVADTAFDVMVFTFIQAQFAALAATDKQRIADEYVRADGAAPPQAVGAATAEADVGPDASEADAGSVLIEVSCLGVAVALSLLTLLAVAAGPLQLDRHALAPTPVRVILPLTLLLAVIVLLASQPYLRKKAPTNSSAPVIEGRLNVRAGALFLGGLPAGVLLIAVSLLWQRPVHLPLLAGLVGGITFVFTARTLVSTTMHQNLIHPKVGQRALATFAACATGSGAFWLVAEGAWRGESQLAGGWLAGTMLCVIAAGAVAYIAAGFALASGLPEGTRDSQFVLSRKASTEFVALDGIILAVVTLIGVAFPLYAATRDQDLHASALAVVSSMVFLPGLISGVFWGLKNWKSWEELNQQSRDRGLVVRPVHEAFGKDRKDQQSVEERRIQHVKRHLRRNRLEVLALMSCGLGYLAYVLLR